MNKLFFFTDSTVPLKYFNSIEKSSVWSVEVASHKELRKVLKNPDHEAVFVIDYDSIPENEKKKNLNYFIKKDNYPRLVIDRKNILSDPSDFIMKGCDYIGGDLLKAGIKLSRINKYIKFFNQILKPENQNEESCVDREVSKPDYIAAENGWSDIKSGKDYSFFMLFTEISIPLEWKKKSGNLHLNQLKQTFQNVAEKITSEYDGKLWIWNEYGGLILFPFTGKSSNPVIPGMKLLLNRVLISIEEFNLHASIRLRVAMHLGTTKWKARGKTGTIISDSLNSIFHLGTKYTPLNDMDITEEVYNELPEGIKKMFSDAGMFEARRIYRLCHLEVIN